MRTPVCRSASAGGSDRRICPSQSAIRTACGTGRAVSSCRQRCIGRRAALRIVSAPVGHGAHRYPGNRMDSRKVVVVCALVFAGWATAVETAPDPVAGDCSDREGPCVQSGVITPDRDAKLQVGLAPRAASLPTHYQFWVLQMNLCNSGFAGCYDGGQSVPEAAAAIQGSAPDVVTLNEVCQSDVVQLSSTLAGVYSGSTVVWAFQAAGD